MGVTIKGGNFSSNGGSGVWTNDPNTKLEGVTAQNNAMNGLTVATHDQASQDSKGVKRIGIAANLTQIFTASWWVTAWEWMKSFF